MDQFGESLFNIKNSNKYFYRIVFNNKTGKTILISRYDNIHDSFGINDLFIDENKFKREDIDILLGISSISDSLKIEKTYQLLNFQNNKNDILICINGCQIPIYAFKDKISLNITSNIFSPTVYGSLSRSIFDKFNKNTSIFNIYPTNDFNVVDINKEIKYMNSFINSHDILRKNNEKTLLQISDACYLLPKFYRNVLYTNFIYDGIEDGHIEMIKSNYDEVWNTSQFGENLLKRRPQYNLKTKVIRPGIKTSLFKKENVNYDHIRKVKESFSEMGNKYKFISFCQDTFRSGIDVIIESFFKAFLNNENAILSIYIEPIHCYQSKSKRERIIFYQNIINKIKQKHKIKKQPPIYINYGNTTEQGRINLFKACDCHIMGTRGEGFCLPLIEASLCEIPQIVPNHTGLSEVYPDSMNEFIPTLPSNCGMKQSSMVSGSLEYFGDYPDLGDSPDFSPIHYNSILYDYNEESINWISERMVQEYENKNVEYNNYNIPLLRDKVEKLYNEEKFFSLIKESIPEIEF